VTPAVVAGLCSVTFRSLGFDDVIELAQRAGLGAIEWGADVHLPSGEMTRAEAVRDRCVAAGLACPSYGSYWFAGQSAVDEVDRLLDTAEVIGATTIRVWAPGDPRREPSERSKAVVDALKQSCDLAAERDTTVALEFHPNTLTETADSTCRLLAAVDRANLRTYWQPRPGLVGRAAIDELVPVLDSLAHLHVFSWDDESRRLPLVAHETSWREALALAEGRHRERPVCAYLEFVENDDPDAFLRDAEALRSWIAS
jgi:3-dehydroshikimate dehydratase